MTTKLRPLVGSLSEFVYVSSTQAGYRDLLGALSASVDRLVDPAVASGAQRDRMTRVALSIFIGSFVLAGAMALALPLITGPAGILAAVSATLSISWLAALSVSKARAEPFAAMGALAAAAVALGLLVAVSGGGASPLAFLIVGLAVEPIWAYRSRRAVQVGLGAVALALVSAIFAPIDSVGPALAIFWLPVAAYVALTGLRLAALTGQQVVVEQTALPYVGEAAIALRFAADGEIADAPTVTPEGFGVDPALLIGTGLLDRLHVADRILYMSLLADMRAGAAPSRTELRLRLPLEPGQATADMRYGLFELSRAGKTDAVLRRIEETEQLRDRLVAAEQHSASVAAAKSRLLASVSHELRTPLNAIIGFSDMLLLELCGPLADQRQREHVTLVRDSGHHLLKVVNSILDVSRIESGVHALTLEPFRFSDAVDLCHSMIAAQASAKAIAIKLDIGNEVGELNADRRAVQQILINLVSNAVKFTPEGGVITIAAERIGSRVNFSVEDNGIGIDAADLVHIGQPFAQVRNDYTRQFDGLGLGLSLVKGLVTLHGGAMEIESAPGEGTKVTVSLPVNGQTVGIERLILLDNKRAKEAGNGEYRKTA